MEKGVFTYCQKGIVGKERYVKSLFLQAKAHKTISEICYRLNREITKHVALHGVADNTVIPCAFKDC